MIFNIYAQNPTLTFTADSNGKYVQLNSILIENISSWEGGDTTLYFPDTVLVLDDITGIEDMETNENDVFTVFQNYPNPIKNRTTVSIYLPRRQNVIINISNIVGKELIHKEYSLIEGGHSFTFKPGRESLYILSLCVDEKKQTIKMLNSPSHSTSSYKCKLEYNGAESDIQALKSVNKLNNFVYNLGDMLKYTAYSDIGERTFIDTPMEDQTYKFQYATGIPCPDMPTITDIDNNEYNTVLFGEQCWMAENLKTTTYHNGNPIPCIADSITWVNLTSGAYAWYNNDISWKDKYGPLYNWYATIDTNGLCPIGWHVPSYDEWIQMINSIGGSSTPYGNGIKSCRQVNSPLGGECNTTYHPRWNEHNIQYGTDEHGFSGLPGGYRNSNSNFDYIGLNGSWWTSTETTMNKVWIRLLHSNWGNINKAKYSKLGGHSVRCLRD